MPKQVKSVAKGISVLGVTGIVCKLIGLLFNIPLSMIGEGDLKVADIFSLVYPTYTLLLTVSSAGLPVAVSRMVAGFLAGNDVRNARNTFRIALKILFTVGCFFSLMMALLNGVLVNIVGSPRTSLGFYAITPCVMIVCVLSAFRGFVQGQQNMVPTAVSQLIEQVGKVLISLPLAYIGVHVYHNMEYAAAGALLGVTLAEAIAAGYMVVRYYIRKKEFDSLPEDPDAKPWENRKLLRRLILIAVPITISACIIPLSGFIDSSMMVKRMMVAGLSEKDALRSFGTYEGAVIRLINIPTALALAISMSMVPSVSARYAVHDKDGVRQESHTGMRFAFLIGFPCSVGMSILAGNIVSFFYAEAWEPYRIRLATELLTFSAMTVVLFTVVQATSSILQGIRKQNIPMYSMIAGVVVKIILNFILIGTPGIDIHGGPYASIACYGIVMIVNMIYVCKYAEMKFNWLDWLVRPGLAAAVMGAVVYLLKTALPGGRIATIICVAAGVVVFLGAAILFGAIRKEELNVLFRRRKKA